MASDTLQADSTSAKSIHNELKELADSINQIIRGIKAAQEPLTESHSKVPQATEQLEQITKQTEDAAHRMLDMVEAITGREGEIEAQIKELRRALPTTYFRHNSRVKLIVETIRDKALSNQNDAYAIMDALQFQDITSQQVNHAISLLEQVENRLQDALTTFDVEAVAAIEPGRKQRAFDPNARYSPNSAQQSSVDELVSEIAKKSKDS
jgi:chemotaxis regulatin CheY-phosphate phosphatase CheZ